MANCGACGSAAVVKLSSINMVLCSICRRYTYWHLAKGQESTLIHNKRGTDDEPEQDVQARDA